MREQKHSILLSEKTILDIEQAHLPYGGYSIGASFVGLRRNRLAKPILIPQEIKAAIDQGSISSSICKIEPSNIRTTQLPNNFYKLFSNTLKEVFNETLVFAFVFGSIAKQYATSDHDIDIFLCFSSYDIDKTSVFRQWVISLHQQLGFSYDDKYPVEVISLDKIREMLSELPRMILKLENNHRKSFDYVSWAQILSDAKICVVGDREMLYQIENACIPWPQRWKQRALELLGSASALHPYRDPLYFIRKVYTFADSDDATG